MRQPIMLSRLFPTFCSFGRQNLFHKSQNINYDRSIGPRTTTKVSQEVWASSLGIKQEEPTYFPAEKEMEPNTSKYQEKPNLPKTKVSVNSGMTPKDSIPTAEASVKTKKKSKSGQKKKKSKGGQKKKKSTNEPSLKIKISVKQEPIEDLTEKLEAGAQSADGARIIPLFIQAELL